MKVREKEYIDQLLDNKDYDRLLSILKSNVYYDSSVAIDGFNIPVGTHTCKCYRDKDLMWYIYNEIMRRNINPLKFIPYVYIYERLIENYFDKHFNKEEFESMAKEFKPHYHGIHEIEKPTDDYIELDFKGITRELNRDVSKEQYEQQMDKFISKIPNSKNKTSNSIRNLAYSIILYNINKNVISHLEMGDIISFVGNKFEELGYEIYLNYIDTPKVLCNDYPLVFTKCGMCYYVRKTDEFQEKLSKNIPNNYKFNYVPEEIVYRDYIDSPIQKTILKIKNHKKKKTKKGQQ